jgi:pseudouridine-5'-phosphate glycosidase
MEKLPNEFVMNKEVGQARKTGKPIVALESTVITHGLPRPDNIKLARDMEAEIREKGAVPATIAVMKGKIHIGLEDAELDELANTEPVRKISRRDFGIALARKESGGTTVAGTLIAAHMAGLKIFATGGIGGIHRGGGFDISADLPELARTPLVVVCAGAKAILDIPNTLEYLETVGVPVVGYQTDEFPAFYSTSSGYRVGVRANSAKEVAEIAQAQWKLGIQSAILVVVPPPADVAIPAEKVEGAIQQAINEAHEKKVSGSAVTPFLLSRVAEMTGGSSLKANLGLLKNNAKVAAEISKDLYPPIRTTI